MRADRRVERVTSVEAKVMSPFISPDMITEIVAAGAPSRIAATLIERISTPALYRSREPNPGSSKSLRTKDRMSQVRFLDMREREREAPIIKRASGRAILEIISKNLCKTIGRSRPKNENANPAKEEIMIGFKQMARTIFRNDALADLLVPEKMLKDKTERVFCERMINAARNPAIPRPLSPMT